MFKRKLGDGSVPTEESLEALRKAYTKAKKAHRADKSDGALKKARDEAKRALERAEAEAGTVESIASTTGEGRGEEKGPSVVTECMRDDEVAGGSSAKGDEGPSPSTSDAGDVRKLEETYRKALAAFKADKADKDLRRAKTATRRALDAAVAAASDGDQLPCRDCSQKFIFSGEEKRAHEERGWKDPPIRCAKCERAQEVRRAADRTKLDEGKGRNMCYAFQRGECRHGSKCKFSHNPEHGGTPGSTSGGNDTSSGKKSQTKSGPRIGLEQVRSRGRETVSGKRGKIGETREIEQ